MSALLERQELHSGWRFKQKDGGDDSWSPVAKVPTVVHLDLLENNRIPDPFKAMNELAVEWVGEKTWVYQTTFAAPPVPKGGKIDLVFDGLDTFATVRLNDTIILTSDNMFLKHRVNVNHLIRASENSLEIEFDSALLRGRELEKQHPEHRFLCHNGETGRLAVRKAQYHWGWDWGPVLMTAGPWRPVEIEVYHAVLEDFWASYKVSEDLKLVTGDVIVKGSGTIDEARLFIQLGGQDIAHQSVNTASSETIELPFRIDNPELWFPHGYGEQPLYDVTVELLSNGHVLDRSQQKTGFRRSELVQKNDAKGQSFYFRVNNLDVFCGGSNWIPADNFLPRVSPQKYRDWLQLMVEGNQVMTRVWGGGIYEKDIFYNTCDELGILVWQDFLFACGSYPIFPSLLDSIRKEATYNLQRLRRHPSVVILAGNNEDYQIQEEFELDYDYSNKNPDSWLKCSFPARYIYEHLLPNISAKEAPAITYWPSSPFSSGKLSYDLTIGDVHQWNVWHGTQEKYQRYDQIGGRFNSEFGMAAFPSFQTVESFVADTSELFPQSRTLDFHNKADGHERRIATYVAENFRMGEDLKTYIYLTQLMQSEALLHAYRGWRRQWGEDRYCGGALVWQLNDCWPATSWGIVDYYLRKKPSFYTVTRSLQSVSVGVQRQHHDWSVCHARPAKTSKYTVWIASSKLSETTVDFELRFVSVKTGKDIKPAIIKKDVVVVANGTTHIVNDVIDNAHEEPYVVAARILVDGVCISRDVDWPQPFKYLSFKDRGVEVRQSGNSYIVAASKPTKGFVFEERDGIHLNDNCIDVIPGDEQKIQVQGLQSHTEPLAWRYLGMNEQ